MSINRFIRAYTEQCNYNGGERIHLLQKAIASAVAYSAPMFVGEPGEVDQYYRNGVVEGAIKFISEFNESFILNTDLVLADVRLLWEGRYMTLNDYTYVDSFEKFHRSLCVPSDITTTHEYWTGKLMQVVAPYFKQERD